MNTTRKYDTLKYLDNRLPFTWRGVIVAFGAVALLFVGAMSLGSGDTRSGWWLLILGLVSAVVSIWCFHNARKLRSMEKARRADRSS